MILWHCLNNDLPVFLYQRENTPERQPFLPGLLLQLQKPGAVHRFRHNAVQFALRSAASK